MQTIISTVYLGKIIQLNFIVNMKKFLFIRPPILNASIHETLLKKNNLMLTMSEKSGEIPVKIPQPRKVPFLRAFESESEFCWLINHQLAGGPLPLILLVRQ
jgi:hypothetical protein